MATKLTTGKVRFSFPTLVEPKAMDGGAPKYSIQLLIPKSDTATVNKINEAMKEAAERFRQKNGQSSLPANPVTPLHDGDGVKPNTGEPYGPECKGCWVMSASASESQRPVVVDAFRNEVDASTIYAGCYGRASINFYGYSNRRKGIGCGLLAVQFLTDGEPFGTVGSANDFDDDYAEYEAVSELDDIM